MNYDTTVHDAGMAANDPVPLRLGRFLRAKREACGGSYEDPAYECGLHRTYIGAVERGEYNVTVLTLWAIGEMPGVCVADAMAAASPGKRRD